MHDGKFRFLTIDMAKMDRNGVPTDPWRTHCPFVYVPIVNWWLNPQSLVQNFPLPGCFISQPPVRNS